MTPQTTPATCVALALDHDGPLYGIALLGPSGAGKTRTALDLITRCPFARAKLISDDITLLSIEGSRIIAAPPRAISGFAELRGTGITSVPILDRYPLAAAFRLALSADRMPDDCPPWAPFGEDGPKVPEYRWPPGNRGLVLFLRSVLAGHSVRAAFDNIPSVNRGEETAP